MGILSPVTDAFYHIKDKSKRLENLYKTYLHQRDMIEIDGRKFNDLLDRYKTMLIYNNALLIVVSQTTLTDEEFAQWLEENKQFMPGKIETPYVAEVISFVADAVGGLYVIKSVKNIGKVVLSKVFGKGEQAVAEEMEIELVDLSTPLLESVSECENAGLSIEGEEAAETLTEDVTEEAVESATAGSMGAAAAGGAIVIALGIDLIISWINSADEAHEIEKQTNALQSKLDIVNTYLSTLNAHKTTVEEGIKKQEEQFIKTMKILKKIQKPKNIDTSMAPTVDNCSKFLVAMHNAQYQYGILSTVKNDWYKYKTNHIRKGRSYSWEVFAEEQMDFMPDDFTDAQYTELLNYVKQYITEKATITK